MTTIMSTAAESAGSTSDHERRVSVDGLETTYRRHGNGPALLYLHDEALSGAWIPLHDELADSFDVIVPQHPGFGGTPMPPDLRDFTDIVLHYDAFLDALGVEEVHLVGDSLGAWMAAEFAVFYPRRCASLTLIAPLGLRVPGAPAADQFRMTPGEREAVLLGTTGSEHARHLLSSRSDVESAVRAYEEAITFARLTWNPRYDIRLETRLKRVAAPSLVIHAADDAVIAQAHSQRYAELLPQGELALVDGAGSADHLVVLQQPARLAKLIIEHGRRGGRIGTRPERADGQAGGQA